MAVLMTANRTSRWRRKKRKEKKRKEKKRKEKKRKDYAFRRQFNEKPSIIPGCPDDGEETASDLQDVRLQTFVMNI